MIKLLSSLVIIILLSGCVNEADNMDKIKKMINKKTGIEREPTVWEITDKAPGRFSWFRVFQSTYDPEIDPMPVDYWILVEDKRIYGGEETEKLMKKEKLELSPEFIEFVTKKESTETIVPELDITEEIRKRTLGATKETVFDIRDLTANAPYRIEGAVYLSSAHQFYIDPVPYDLWIVIDGKVREGREIIDILKEKNIVPKSKQEAINIAKLILAMEHEGIQVYPDFPAGKVSGAKKPSAKEKDGIYEIVLYTSSFPYTWTTKVTVKLGQGIYEAKGEIVS